MTSIVIPPGSTSQSVPVYILNDSGNATNNVSAGSVSATYTRDAGSPVTISVTALASASAAFSPGGFAYVSGERYRLDVPDAAWATGATRVYVDVADATGVRPEPVCVVLDVAVGSRSTYAGGLADANAAVILTNAQAANASIGAIANHSTPVWSYDHTGAALGTFAGQQSLNAAIGVVSTAVGTVNTTTGSIANGSTGVVLTPASVTAIWSAATRSLTTFGTLVADLWAYASRTLTGKTPATLAAADVTGALPANVTQWNGSAVTTGVPNSGPVTISVGTGTGQLNLSGGAVVLATAQAAQLAGLFSTVEIDPANAGKYRLTMAAVANVATAGTVNLGTVPYTVAFQGSTGLAVPGVAFTVDTGTSFQSGTANASGGAKFYAPGTGQFTVAGSQTGLVYFAPVQVPPNASGGSIVVTGASVGTVTPPPAGSVAVQFYARKNDGTPAGGVPFTFQMIQPPDGLASVYPVGSPYVATATSDATTGFTSVNLPGPSAFGMSSPLGASNPRRLNVQSPSVGTVQMVRNVIV